MGASSFVGTIQHRICSFWERRKGIPQGVIVKSTLPVSHNYSVSILTSGGMLKATDERTLPPNATEDLKLETLLLSSKLSSGQICLEFWGRANFLTGQYYERKTVGTRSEEGSYLLLHSLDAGRSGQQRIVYKPVRIASGYKLEATLTIQNMTSSPVSGTIQSVDGKGRKLTQLVLRLKPGAMYSLSLSRLGLKQSGKIIWNPSNEIGSIRAVIEQHIQKRAGKSYAIAKIQRKEGTVIAKNTETAKI